MTSGVKIAKSHIPVVPGTKPSVQNAQLLVSTGVPSLDHVIGGGLPVGTILLIEEDTYGSYAKIILKYFMAEGVVTGHSLLVASRNAKTTQLVSELPAVATSSVSVATPRDEQMTIAWRYQNMKIVDASGGGQAFGHYYDLSKTMEPEIIEAASIRQWDGHEQKWKAESFANDSYVDLLKTVEETLREGEFLITSEPKARNVLRIAIHSLGSRLWLSDNEDRTRNDLLKFFFCLKSLLRNAYAVATITVPTHFFENLDAIVERIEHLSDIAIRLESFTGSAKEANPAFNDYHGLLHIQKLGALNSLAPHYPESMDLAFKLRRKKFVVEVLHLPPELADTAQREQDDGGSISSGCSGGGGRKNLLDF